MRNPASIRKLCDDTVWATNDWLLKMCTDVLRDQNFDSTPSHCAWLTDEASSSSMFFAYRAFDYCSYFLKTTFNLMSNNQIHRLF